LLAEQKVTSFGNARRINRLTTLYQAFNTKPDAITKAASPRTVPTAIGALNALQKGSSLVYRVLNVGSTMIRVHFSKVD
jgi:hypothetical protein